MFKQRAVNPKANSVALRCKMWAKRMGKGCGPVTCCECWAPRINSVCYESVFFSDHHVHDPVKKSNLPRMVLLYAESASQSFFESIFYPYFFRTLGIPPGGSLGGTTHGGADDKWGEEVSRVSC